MTARRKVSVAERRARLARRHRLAPSERTDDVAAIADSLVALHSSDPVSVYLSAMARMAHPSIGAVDDALYEHRSLVRFHAMRRTLWVATPEVAREAHASSTLKVLAAEHRRFVKLLAENDISADGDAWIATRRPRRSPRCTGSARRPRASSATRCPRCANRSCWRPASRTPRRSRHT